ncbi:MAG: tyrosine-protein phosphatase [Ramlibacter sp.]
MAFRCVHLPEPVKGSLWLSSMPGRFEGWPEFEAQARQAGLALVVCLTPMAELAELSPTYHAAAGRGRLPFRWLHLPMRNFGLPDDPGGFRGDVARIAAALRAGDAVMLHCAAGIGRTGTVAACVLKALGLEEDDALQRVRDAGSNPQNAQQSGLVGWF